MEEKMDSEQSYSSSSSSSSESSSGSSESEDEVLEQLRILGQNIELPQELCEDYSVFREFFSLRTWESLDDKHKEQLMEHLPSFTDNVEVEREKTIRMLFNHEPFHFTSPFTTFYNNLRHGNYRPDIAKMRKFLKKARSKQQKHRRKSYYAKLLPDLLISRERLFAAAKAGPPGTIPRLPLLPPKPSSKNHIKPVYVRAKQRYFEELAAIQGEVGGDNSDDENYPGGLMDDSTKLHNSGILGAHGLELSSLDSLKKALIDHRARRQYRENHPELNTMGITLEDIRQRVAIVNGAKKLMFGGQKVETSGHKIKRGSKKHNQRLKSAESKLNNKKPKEELENRPLLPNIKIKSEEASDSENSSFVDTISSPKITKKMLDVSEIKQEVPDVAFSNNLNTISNVHDILDIKEEPLDQYSSTQCASKAIQPMPIKLEDLDGIDMMSLPIDIADECGDLQQNTSSESVEDSPVDVDESLTESTHANFLSLVRALFPAKTAHRASQQELHARCSAVLRSPIAPLNTWYSLSNDWCAELESALEFLTGERGPHPDDFVPYLQFIPDTKMYQWIGAGRDCDAILGRICDRWLKSNSEKNSLTTPPPPRYPTTWTVRTPTSTELAEFRAQERRRFSSASKAFTYLQHGYRAVVGPCARAGVPAPGHSGLLAPARPRHCSLAGLVRDALARLPNGQGTPDHIMLLCRMSQYIASCSDQALMSVITTILDRLQSIKRDPIVKFDQKSGLWTYLHRNRTEDDWLRIASSKVRPHKAALPQSGSTTRSSSPNKLSEHDVSNNEEFMDDNSDSDVDVDDSGSAHSVSHLSSAQLLMQATLTNPPKTAANQKASSKSVTPSKHKTKPTIKTNLTAQKSTLMTQAVKQANLIAQSTKLVTKSNVVKNPIVQHKAQVNQIKQTAPNIQTSVANQKQVLQLAQSKPPQIVQAKSSSPLIQKQTMQIKQPVHTSKSIPIITRQPSLITPSKDIKVAKSNIEAAKASSATQQIMSPKQITIPKQLQLKSSLISDKKISKPVLSARVSFPEKSSQPQPAGQKSEQTVTQGSASATTMDTVLLMSSLGKQKQVQRIETSQQKLQQVTQHSTSTIQTSNSSSVQAAAIVIQQNTNKLLQGTRSLLIRPSAVQTTVIANLSTSSSQLQTLAAGRNRGVVRVLSPATPSSGKSLISPNALIQSGTTAVKKRTSLPSSTAVSSLAQSTSTTVVSSIPTALTSPIATRTVHLAGGRTLQLAANQTVHLPGGQAVQLSSGHTLQLQLPTQTVRLPSGQTVQLASPQNIQALRQAAAAKAQALPPSKALQIPVSTVQIAGQTVQIAGQSVQLTGHTVKLPSGQSVQLAGGNLQTVQLGQNVQLANPGLQLPSGQTVQFSNQTVQLAGQTVQLQSGQTVQLPGGQTLQLSSGQTIQLAGGQTVQVPNQAKKTQIIRAQGSDKGSQPIVAKLLTNAQGQMLSLEGVLGARGAQAGRARPAVRLLAPSARLTRPLLLTSKPLHNIIIQQSDGTSIQVTSSQNATPTQTIMLSNLGGQSSSTPTSTSAPLLKLQQVNPLQQVKLSQAIKIQQPNPNTTVATSTLMNTVRNVIVDGQQVKLVGGRHVLARLLRPSHPPP